MGKKKEKRERELGPGQKAIAKLVARAKLEETIDSYLYDQHCILYGRPFDIHDKDGRAVAVQFFSDFWEAIDERNGS